MSGGPGGITVVDAFGDEATVRPSAVRVEGEPCVELAVALDGSDVGDLTLTPDAARRLADVLRATSHVAESP